MVKIKFFFQHRRYILILILFSIFLFNFLSFKSRHSKIVNENDIINNLNNQKILEQAEEQRKINLFIKSNVLHRDSNEVDESVILNRNCTHIDVVYTWVNGTDPIMLNKRKENGFNIEKDMERFRDYGALKFSLRSIRTFAPWVKNIWILTDSQIPDFFDYNYSDNIKFIFHESFYRNVSHLPTFSSVSIESNFYNLPEEVSNCFLYFNDDVFLKGPVEPTDFFDLENQNQVLFETESIIGLRLYQKYNRLDSYMQSMVLSSQLLDSKWDDKKERFQCDHGVQIYNRTILLTMNKELGEQQSLTSSHKKRELTDLQHSFIYNQFVKRYAPNHRIVKGFNFYGGVSTNYAETRLILQDAFKTNSKVICLNDRLISNSTVYLTQMVDEITNFYQHMVPEPASWEKIE